MLKLIASAKEFIKAARDLFEPLDNPAFWKPALFLLLFSAALALLLLAATSGFTGPVSVSVDTAGRFLSGILGVAFIGGAIYVSLVRTPAPPDPCTLRVFEGSAGGDVIEHFKSLVKQCDGADVEMMGTALAILSNEAMLERLISLVNSGKIRRLELLFANPDSHAVQLRLIEEETGPNIPLIGLGELEHRIRNIIADIERNAQDPSRIAVRLFSHYPTFAMLKVESHYLVYNYSYARLGTMSPLISFSGHCETLRSFFDDTYRRVSDCAVDARSYFNLKKKIRSRKLTRSPFLELPSLAGFAVYFVPDGELYEFGTSILGYDVRAERRCHSQYEDYVGSARPFGFHLTVADAMYASNEHAITLIERLVAHLFRRRIGSIPVEFEVVAGFPDSRSISLKCKDESGKLDALHSELVTFVYTQAVGSNYTLFGAPANRVYCESEARKLSNTALYHAPYVLRCFEPHLTLLSNVPEDEVARVASEISELIRRSQPTIPQSFVISKLAVMRLKGDQWVMPENEIELR